MSNTHPISIDGVKATPGEYHEIRPEPVCMNCIFCNKFCIEDDGHYCPHLLCNIKYRNEWGETVECKNMRKRYRKTCGEHKRVIPQRYFISKFNPGLCIDIKQ